MTTKGPAHRVQSAVIEYGFPQGHLGHLTDAEDKAFGEFREVCLSKDLYSPGDAQVAASHDDATLLRFLRARRFVVPDALKQFVETEDWRKANELDKLYKTIDVDQYEQTRLLYPQWTGRRDRRGIPVYIYEVKHLTAKKMAAYEKSAAQTKTKAKSDGKTPAKLLGLFALYENLTRFVMPICTALMDREHPKTPITQSNNIVDISGVGLKQFWNLRGHMQDASQLATAHYPETLDRIFVIGAPSFFPTVWGWVKKWFDPITTSKIFILSSNDLLPTLESFIDPANIPVKYGGQLDFSFGDLPRLDPALEQVLTWEAPHTAFPSGPMYWETLKSSTGELESMRAIAAGSQGDVDRREVVATIRQAKPAQQMDTNHQTHLSVLERPDLMRAPTAEEYVERYPSHEPEPTHTPESDRSPTDTPIGPRASAIGDAPTPTISVDADTDAGEQMPKRPDLETFVTAREGIAQLAPEGDEQSTDVAGQKSLTTGGI